jgi:hypothetical protein
MVNSYRPNCPAQGPTGLTFQRASAFATARSVLDRDQRALTHQVNRVIENALAAPLGTGGTGSPWDSQDPPAHASGWIILHKIATIIIKGPAVG